MPDDLEGLHRAEVADLHFRLMQYRALLEEHGIEPPDDSGKDGLAHWRDVVEVISAAYDLVAVAEEFKRKLGTSKELLGGSWR